MAKKNSGLSFYNRKKKRVNTSLFGELFSWGFGIFASVFMAAVLAWFLGLSIQVVGDGMEPNLSGGQEIYINRFSYLLSKPQNGHVIVFLPNGNEHSHYYVKRVIAGPGDHLVVKDGIMYVNGLASPWVTEEITNPGIAVNDIYLNNGEFFCIGDNPDSSEDSRSANLGLIHADDILGRAWFHGKTDDVPMGLIR